MQIENKNPTLRKFETFVKLNPTTTSTEKDTILLVEDNPALQQFIQSILTPHYNVIVTENGVEALERLTADGGRQTENTELSRQPSSEATVYRLPSLILSDVMMPEMDGFTLLEKVKADDRFCSIPFILLTARADIQDKLKGLRIGVDDYMTKPFEVDELLLRIKNLIANVKSRQLTVSSEQLAVKSNPQTEIDEQKETVNGKPSSEATVNRQPSTVDLEWLAKVETIAKREVRNSKYSVEDLAYEMHMSRSQLYRKLKQTTGLTPNRYFRNVKLHHAKYLLENEDIQTLTEVTYAIGFENITHFVKLYEAEFGKRPHDYLKKQGV
jgi:DNA-binding response OmpR family regulator